MRGVFIFKFFSAFICIFTDTAQFIDRLKHETSHLFQNTNHKNYVLNLNHFVKMGKYKNCEFKEALTALLLALRHDLIRTSVRYYFFLHTYQVFL